MDSLLIDARFKTNFTMVISGPSLSGKSTLIKNILINADRLIDAKIDYVVIFTGSQDYTLRSIANPSFTVSFVEGLPDNFDEYILPNKRGIFVIDDLETKASQNEAVLEVFSVKCHHENVSIILVLQNLFNRGSKRIGFLRNCHYLILFQNPIDQSVNFIVASRLNPVKRKKVLNLIFSVLEKHRYILLDGRQDTPVAARFRTDLFNPLFQRCFVLK
jgi:ABC-type iron transport system FetAB ATPase subunit